MRAKRWITGWGCISLICLGIISYKTYKVDPYFHYHAPDTDNYYYELENERSQNDGISRNFDYDSIIIGSSMCENFKTSEMDQLFGTKSVKLPYSGATYHELGQCIDRAISYNDETKIVISGLDMVRYGDDSTLLRTDLGTFPFYLYDSNPFNDIEYLLNRDVAFNLVLDMEIDSLSAYFESGITSFDDYACWFRTSGINAVKPGGISVDKETDQIAFDENTKEVVIQNITSNITDIANRYPDVDFYYFLTPYSAVWWGEEINSGDFYKQIEKERCVIEQLLRYDNIKLFSFNLRTDITTDINNYCDERHYGFWINSLILKWMSEDKYRITPENYEEYLRQEQEFYYTFDYESLNSQEDYSKDYYAAALARYELTGIEPLLFDEIKKNGESILLENISNYRYVVFYDTKVSDGDVTTINLYDNDDSIVYSLDLEYNDVNAEPRLHVVVLDEKYDCLKVEFGNSDCADYIFSGIGVY